MYDVQARSMVQMGNGNFLVAGTQAFANGFLSVHAPNGHTTQSFYLSPSALSSYSDFTQITKINDTLAIVGGKISIVVGATVAWQGISIAVNQDGTVLWMLTHGLNDPGLDATVRDIERINDSTFLCLSSSIGNSSNALSKIDFWGNIIWTKSIEYNSSGFQLNDVLIDDTTLIVAGHVVNSGNFLGVFLRLDSLGNVQEGASYSHSIQPDFTQVIALNHELIVTSKSHATSAISVVKMDSSANVLTHKSFSYFAMMPEDEALKPLYLVDSTSFWFWNGSSFGASAYLIDALTLLPMESFMHNGNIQTIMQDTTLQILATGPLYGVKNQLITQKHFAISEADSLEAIYTFCSYPSNDLPLNEIAPVKATFSPTVTQGSTPFPLFYPMLSNEPWVDEPWCVEMLGQLDEEVLTSGPNPCDAFIKFDNYPLVNIEIFTLDGKLVTTSVADETGKINTVNIPGGSYFFRFQNQLVKVAVSH